VRRDVKQHSGVMRLYLGKKVG